MMYPQALNPPVILEAARDLPPAVVLRVERGEGNVIEVRWDYGTGKAPTADELRELAGLLYRDMA